jgi:hypothetical protein
MYFQLQVKIFKIYLHYQRFHNLRKIVWEQRIYVSSSVVYL